MVAEPISTSLSTIASVLSIASTVKSLMRRRRISKEEALEVYIQDAKNKQEVAFLNKPDMREAVLGLMIISEKLLVQLKEEADECEEKYIAARKPADQTTRGVLEIQSSQCMCNTLRTIRRHNGMNLPDEGPYKDWWCSYNCED